MARRVITTSISDEDYNFMKANQLKPSQLINSTILSLKSSTNNEELDNMRAKLEALDNLKNRFWKFLEKEQLTERWRDFLLKD